MNKVLSIYYESLILIQLIVFIYSYNFHSLWLIYDFTLLFCLFCMISNKIKKKNLFVLFFLPLLFLLLIYSITVNRFHFISLLSFWDTYKHLILFIFFFPLFKKIDISRKKKFLNNLYIISFVSFFIQAAFVLCQYRFYQYREGTFFFDDVAGSFGDGSTHALGFFTLFFIIFLICYKKPLIITISVIFISIIINYYAENLGFYVLLAFSLFFVVGNRIGYSRTVFYSIIIIIFIGIFQKEILTKYHPLTRIAEFNFIKIYTSGSDVTVAGREVILGYALYLGGLLGNGFGAYSEIYNINGWLLKNVLNSQICISEATHLVSEIGVVGFILTAIVYIGVIFKSIENKQVAMYGIGFLFFGLFYNRFLMDERLIFLFFLITLVFALSIDFNKKCKAN